MQSLFYRGFTTIYLPIDYYGLKTEYTMNQNRKRPCNPYNYLPSKKPAKLASSSSEDNEDPIRNTEAALHFLQSLFPHEKFEGRIPPIVMKHQFYALMKDTKTNVDKQLNDLRNQGKVRFFKLGPLQDDTLAVISTKDYTDCVLKRSDGNKTVEEFLCNVVTCCPDVSYRKEQLIKNYSFKEENITELVRHGLLTVRDVGSWWLSIPHAGEFMKYYLQGQKCLISTIRRCKFKEILRQELEGRKLIKAMKLGMTYHLYDIIGAELVSCIETSSGQLLRLNDT